MLEFEDVWLEVRTCMDAGRAAASVDGEMLKVPAISEVLEAAANASAKHPGMWDYSRRLDAREVELVRGVVRFTSAAEDGRSVSVAASVKYKGSCYTLTLFAIKLNQ